MAKNRTVQDLIAEGQRLRPSDLAVIPIDPHDGLPITRFRANLTNAGDGLSEGFNLQPVHLPMRAEVAIVVLAQVVSHEYDLIKGDDEGYMETAVLRASGALVVDPDLVAEVADVHMKRIFAAREAAEEERRQARGEFRLDGMDGDWENGYAPEGSDAD